MKWSSNITIVQNLYSKTFYYKIIIFYLKNKYSIDDYTFISVDFLFYKTNKF